MNKEIKMGMNRTGLQMSPIHSQELLNRPSPSGPADTDLEFISTTESDSIRRVYDEISGPVGTVPMPGSLKGAVATGMQKMTGINPEILIDKLGERLAFERTGVRLYDALINKHQAEADSSLVPLDELRKFQIEEARHFDLLKSALEAIGADPTAVTPAADLDGVAASGLIQAIHDPRASFTQALHAIHVAELADNDGWDLLIDLSRKAGLDEWAAKFETALDEETIHLDSVREWMRKLIEQEAGITVQ